MLFDVVFVLPLKEQVHTQVDAAVYQTIVGLLTSKATNRISVENVIIPVDQVRACYFPRLDNHACMLMVRMAGGPLYEIPIFSKELGDKARATLELFERKSPTGFHKTIEQDFGRFAIIKHDAVIDGVELYARQP